MKKYLSYIITICLLAIVILMLIRNRKEIDTRIAFAEQEVEAYPVRILTVENGKLDLKVEVAGILAAAEELMVMAETQGRVIRLNKSEGQWINKGEVLAEVDNELMKAELEVASSSYDKAKKDLERAQTLSEGGAMTQQQLEGLVLNEQASRARLVVAQKRLADATVKAPISGYINRMFIKQGSMIGPAVPICEIVNVKSMKMTVKVSERDALRISAGMPVEIKLINAPEVRLAGTVLNVSAKADYALQYAVDLMLSADSGIALKAGMAAVAIFTFEDQKQGIVIPRYALVGSVKSPEVYVIEENRAVRRQIVIDFAEEESVKVYSGLTPGEKIVLAGQTNLRDGVEVRVID